MMNAPRFIDTNVLLYSISRDPAEAAKRAIAIALLDTELSVQVLQEFYVRATRATRPDALAHEIAVGLLRTWLRFAGVENGAVEASFRPSSSYIVTMKPAWRVRSRR